MSYLSYAQINSLEEISFIGGSYYTLEFVVYNQNGSPANLSGATCTWKMSPYGNPDIITLSYNGTVTGTNTFEVYLLSADTLALSGKYVHQPLVVESGNSYRSQQGVINITPAID
jgi:hypothetical protein